MLKIKNTLKRLGLLQQASRLKNFLFDPGLVVARSFLYYFYNDCLTHFPNHAFRIFYLKKVMNVEIGKESFIHMGCLFYENVRIGNNTVIGRECHLLGNITIGNNVSITAKTYIISSSHHVDSSKFEAYTNPVEIEDYVWVGARAMILPGVRIGRGAILGAASIATKSIPEYAICAGNPARQIGRRSITLDYNLTYKPYFQ